MAQELLGATFDIHGGGNDLMFPHHENEIAQSCCANGDDSFARYWLHNEMLQVEGKKMSKSLGNFFTVRDLLDQGVPGEVIRFVMLSTHYRKPMDWTERKREEAERTLRGWYIQISGGPDTDPSDDLLELLGDDLNTHAVLTACHRLSQDNDIAGLRSALRLVGLLDRQIPEWAVEQAFDLTDVEAFLSDARATAMETKDFSEVDRIKTALTALGIEVQMSRDGVSLTPPPGFDRSALEGVL